MAEILHRVSIAAPVSTVHDLIASADGVGKWWSGRPLEGEAAVGKNLAVYFGESENAAAVMEVLSSTPDEVVWRCVEGPDSWLETQIKFSLKPTGQNDTTLLFEHSGWREASEFMAGCSTNWGAYLTSLKSGAEGHEFGAYPLGEVSRWS
ncbi:MAG: SRPBCC domain-containing protein [Solirubrobacteraceae bacterium]